MMGECVYGRVCGQAACNHSDATTCWTNLKVVPGKTTDCSKARSFLPNILSILLSAYLCLQRSSGGNWWGANLRIIIQGLNCSHPLSWLPNCRSHSLSHVRRRQEWCNEADFNLMLPWLSLKQIFFHHLFGRKTRSEYPSPTPALYKVGLRCFLCLQY